MWVLIHAVYQAMDACIHPAGSGLVNFQAFQALQNLVPPLLKRVKHSWQLSSTKMPVNGLVCSCLLILCSSVQ